MIIRKDHALHGGIFEEIRHSQAMGNLVLLQQLHPHRQQAWMYRVLKNLFIDQRPGARAYCT